MDLPNRSETALRKRYKRSIYSMNYKRKNLKSALKVRECVLGVSGNRKPAVAYINLRHSEQGCKQLLLEGSISGWMTGSDLYGWRGLRVLTAADVLRVTRHKGQTLTTLMCPNTRIHRKRLINQAPMKALHLLTQYRQKTTVACSIHSREKKNRYWPSHWMAFLD